MKMVFGYIRKWIFFFSYYFCSIDDFFGNLSSLQIISAVYVTSFVSNAKKILSDSSVNKRKEMLFLATKGYMFSSFLLEALQITSRRNIVDLNKLKKQYCNNPISSNMSHQRFLSKEVYKNNKLSTLLLKLILNNSWNIFRIYFLNWINYKITPTYSYYYNEKNKSPFIMNKSTFQLVRKVCVFLCNRKNKIKREKILICGYKGIGKSHLANFILNVLAKKDKKLKILTFNGNYPVKKDLSTKYKPSEGRKCLEYIFNARNSCHQAIIIENVDKIVPKYISSLKEAFKYHEGRDPKKAIEIHTCNDIQDMDAEYLKNYVFIIDLNNNYISVKQLIHSNFLFIREHRLLSKPEIIKYTIDNLIAKIINRKGNNINNYSYLKAICYSILELISSYNNTNFEVILRDIESYMNILY